MREYNIRAKDKSGNYIGEFADFVRLRCSKTLNRYGRCSFSVPVTYDQLDHLTSLRKYDIEVLRDDVVIWAGEQAHRSGSLKSGSSNLIEITSFGYIELLSHMYTEESQVYDQIDSGDILWDVIDTFQQKTSGDLGFTEGSIEATKNRDRKYYNKNILDLGIELTEVIEGFDFDINNDKELNVYARKGIDKSSTVVFEYGVNIKEVSRIGEDFTKPVTSAIVLGEQVDNVQERVDVTNASNAAIFGLRQDRRDAYNVTESATLTDKGTEMVRRGGVPLLTVRFKQAYDTYPKFGSLDVGDVVKLKILEGIYSINNKFRIYGWELSFDQKGNEIVEYLVSIQL